MSNGRNRDRFGLRLTGSERDRTIARWIDEQLAKGFDVSAQIKDILYEVITGTSAITGKAVQAYFPEERRDEGAVNDPADEVFQKFASFSD